MNWIRVKLDSKVLVDVVNSKVGCPWAFVHHLRVIQVLLNGWSAKICHVYKETNAVVDALSRRVTNTSIDECYTLEDLHLFIRGMVKLDFCPFTYVCVRNKC